MFHDLFEFLKVGEEQTTSVSLVVQTDIAIIKIRYGILHKTEVDIISPHSNNISYL